MNHALERDFCLVLFSSWLLQGTYSNWFQHMLQSSSKVNHPLRAYISHKQHLSSDGTSCRSLLLHRRFYGQGLSDTPNLCCNSKLEREGLQNSTKFTREARSRLLKRCLKDLDWKRSFQKTNGDGPLFLRSCFLVGTLFPERICLLAGLSHPRGV